MVGAGHLPIESILPETRGTLRLPRNATRGVLQRRLERILQAVKNGAPELLDGGEQALDRVLRAGADPA